MSLFNRSSVTVGARVVAGSPTTSKGCVYILDPTASQALQVQGSFDFEALNCGIIVDSSASDALSFTGKAGLSTLVQCL